MPRLHGAQGGLRSPRLSDGAVNVGLLRRKKSLRVAVRRDGVDGHSPLPPMICHIYIIYLFDLFIYLFILLIYLFDLFILFILFIYLFYFIILLFLFIYFVYLFILFIYLINFIYLFI